jgi:hypothetical protein
MEQNNMNATLTEFQVEYLSKDILVELYSEADYLEGLDPTQLDRFDNLTLNRVKAILCTLSNDAYENIVKVVRDKLNLNDLFDNRHKYLN